MGLGLGLGQIWGCSNILTLSDKSGLGWQIFVEGAQDLVTVLCKHFDATVVWKAKYVIRLESVASFIHRSDTNVTLYIFELKQCTVLCDSLCDVMQAASLLNLMVSKTCFGSCFYENERLR